MPPSIKAFAAPLLAVMIASSMTACSKDPPSGPSGTLLSGGNQPDVILQAAPANDDFDTPVIISGLPFTDTIPSDEATTAEDDPTPTCGGTGPTVWYAYTASRTITMQANTFGSDYDTDLVVYTGTRGNLVELACNDDAAGSQSSVSVEVARGQTYYFMVGTFGSGPGGTLVFNLEAEPRGPSSPHFRNSGKGAVAFWPSDDSKCILTSIEFRTSERSFKPGSLAPVRESIAQVAIDRFDSCTETPLGLIFASTTDELVLQVDNRLTFASLQATLPGIDLVSGTEVVVEVNLAWTGAGDPITTWEKSRQVFPGGGVLIGQFMGTRTDATAAGTVSIDGVNLTPNPTFSAAIFDAKQSTLTIEHTTRRVALGTSLR
jgi:hypothetical protein